MSYKYGRLLGTVLLIGLVLIGITAIKVLNAKPPTYKLVTACNVLTPAIAHNIGGNNLQLIARKPLQAKDSQTSFCIYQLNNRAVVLVVRSAKTAKGLTLNKDAFSSPPASSQKLTGYGDAAYWTPSFGQLNILSHGQWYIMANGSGAATGHTLVQAEQLASQLLNRL